MMGIIAKYDIDHFFAMAIVRHKKVFVANYRP